jgi:type I restriction enzyme M protein
LAGLAEVKDQDFSLNPGRYVGVVIEEDGKTEEEFIEDFLRLDKQLVEQAAVAKSLEELIHKNTNALIGE